MTPTFQRFSGWCAVLAAASSLVFTVAFSVVVQEGERWAQWVSAVTLTAGALITLPVLVALHARLRAPEEQFGRPIRAPRRRAPPRPLLRPPHCPEPQDQRHQGHRLVQGLVVSPAFFRGLGRSLLSEKPVRVA